MANPSNKQLALITGATSGIGAEYAHIIMDSTAELSILLCEMVEGLMTGE